MSEDTPGSPDGREQAHRVDDVPTDVGEPEPALEAHGAASDAVADTEPAPADAPAAEEAPAGGDSPVAAEPEREVAAEPEASDPASAEAAGEDTAALDAIAVEQAEADPEREARIPPVDPAGPDAAPVAPGPDAAPVVVDREAVGTEAVDREPTRAPVYVAVPTPPEARGNRLMGILIAVVATVAYAIVSAAVALGLYALRGQGGAVDVWERYLPTAGFWLPVVVFFLAYALLIAIVNRAGWWAYLIGSVFVGAVVYFGYIGGALLTVHAWTLSPDGAQQFLGTLWANPLTFAAAVVAREASLWFGGWIARRGRRVREANLAARREYDRRIAAGPDGLAD